MNKSRQSLARGMNKLQQNDTKVNHFHSNILNNKIPQKSSRTICFSPLVKIWSIWQRQWVLRWRSSPQFTSKHAYEHDQIVNTNMFTISVCSQSAHLNRRTMRFRYTLSVILTFWIVRMLLTFVQKSGLNLLLAPGKKVVGMAGIVVLHSASFFMMNSKSVNSCFLLSGVMCGSFASLIACNRYPCSVVNRSGLLSRIVSNCSIILNNSSSVLTIDLFYERTDSDRQPLSKR